MQHLSSSRLAQLIDQATSSDLSRPSIELCRNVVEEILSNTQMAQEASKLIKKKLTTNQPKTIFLALILLDMAM